MSFAARVLVLASRVSEIITNDFKIEIVATCKQQSVFICFICSGRNSANAAKTDRTLLCVRIKDASSVVEQVGPFACFPISLFDMAVRSASVHSNEYCICDSVVGRYVWRNGGITRVPRVLGAFFASDLFSMNLNVQIKFLFGLQ